MRNKKKNCQNINCFFFSFLIKTFINWLAFPILKSSSQTTFNKQEHQKHQNLEMQKHLTPKTPLVSQTQRARIKP